MTRAQYAGTRRRQELEEYLFAVLKCIAIVELIVAIVVLTWGNINLKNLEESYPSIGIIMEERMSLKEQERLYIQSLELPEETYEENQFEAQEDVVLVDTNIGYYNPTEEERYWAERIAKSEAGIEDAFGQTLVINVAINNMRASGYSNLIEEFTASGRYSSVINGVPCIKDNGKWIPVTEDMLSDSLKAAVDAAFEKDYTEALLKEVAEVKGLGETYYEGGALYFYNPNAVSDYQASLRANIKVTFQHGRHVFYRVWNK